MTSPKSPFQYNRWESDTDHLIWIPKQHSEWEKKRSIYITGSRGTGKTTLLRAFDWRERLYNDSLRSQLVPDDPFSSRYIGVYLNMPNFVSANFRNWPPRESYMDLEAWEEEKARVYSLYIEYQILQLFISAIKELRAKDILLFSSSKEKEYVQKIIDERPEINNFLTVEKENARLNDLRICFKMMHEKIRYCARQNTLFPFDELSSVLQLGKSLNEVGDLLLKLCSNDDSSNNEPWTLKVCLDQVESPDRYQQKAINTMVAALGDSDVSFAVAAVEESTDIISTFLPNHPLTDADRIHYDLDETYQNQPSKFKEFITNVTELRIRKYTGKNDVTVDLAFILGEWDINSLLYPAIKKSESNNVKELLARAENNLSNRYYSFKYKNLPYSQLIEDSLDEEQDNNLSIPPIFQTYLIEKMGLELDDTNATDGDIRAFKSSVTRKGMVVAMLCLCKEYKLDVPYAGYQMVVEMSDQSIRDFLLQMHHIYLEQDKTADEFIQSPVHIKKQFKALQNASYSRYKGIKNDMSYEIGQLIAYLGKITAELQSSYNDRSLFGKIEKGRFKVDYTLMRNQRQKEELQDLLKLASDSFCIRVMEKSETFIIFRLHNLFAPTFSYSYRGAYTPVTILGEDILYLCTNRNESEVKNKIGQIVSNLLTANPNMTLERWTNNVK